MLLIDQFKSDDIRAIRLGRESKISDEAKKFLEKNIVDKFYSNISFNVKDKFLTRKSDIEKKINQLKKIQNELRVLSKKDEHYNQKLNTIKRQ